MLSPSDFNTAVPKFTNGNYASNPVSPLYVAEPDAVDYNRGTEPLQTLPAQWWNWLCNQFTSRFNKLNTYTKNIFDELTQLLSLLNISPDGTESTITIGQLKNFFKELYPTYVSDKLELNVNSIGGESKCISTISQTNGKISATAVDIVNKADNTTTNPMQTKANGYIACGNNKTVTGAPIIGTGGVIKIFFNEDITASNTTTALTISYNGSTKTIKAIKNGNKVDVFAHKLSTSTYKYIQRYTVLEIAYDGTDFIIIGNPVVISDTDYSIYADGKVGDEIVGTVIALATTDVPYGWHLCDGSSVLRTDYPKLFEKFNTQKYDGTNTLLSRYGYADSTHFNLPDYREVALVGIGTNGTDGLGTSGHNHDVFTLGEFKDDQVQEHSHHTVAVNASQNYARLVGSGDIAYGCAASGGGPFVYEQGQDGRKGDVTRTKEKGVNYLIKVL